MAHVITIAQQKGGAGKTTVTAQLAVALSQTKVSGKKARVAIIDIDPQASLSAWFEEREQTLGERNTLTHSKIQGWRLKKEVDRLSYDHDFILIDSPPHAESEANIAIRASDITLIPVQPSPMDLWACKPTIKIAHDEKAFALIVLNRVVLRANLSTVIIEKVEALNAQVAKAHLGNRVAYAASLLEGKGVVETESGGLAAEEILTLAKEIRSLSKAQEKAA